MHGPKPILFLRMLFKSINPYSGETLAEFPATTPKVLDKKLTNAAQAFSSWRKTPFATRAALLRKVADALENGKDLHARTMSLEMGKPIGEARAEAEKCAWVCRYYADYAEKFLAPEPVASSASESYVRYDPLGTVLAIMPWNFPYWQVLRFAAPTLMAGNTVILKHAPNVSQCALDIEQLFLAAGFPEGVFQTVLAPVEQVAQIMAHPAVQAVSLTGSTKAGASVAALAGKHVKKSLLELGGSDPFVVLRDADLDLAAKVAVQSRMINAGQSCIAAKRFIVEQTVAEAFTSKVEALVKALKTGNPLDEATQIGPLARVDLAESLKAQADRTVKAGARLCFGAVQEGARFSPALLTGVEPGMAAFDEETFGPLAVIVEAKDEQAAIGLANQTGFGLGASLWTRDIEKGKALAEDIFAGSVFVNALVKSDPRLPFGGIRQSGYGRELSLQGIREFVNAKTVFVG